MIRLCSLFLLAFLLFSCGDPVKPEDKTIAAPDPFRESVMTLKRSGLLKDIPEKSLDSLISLYRKDSLNGLKNLLVYSGDILSLDLKMNDRAPHEVYSDLVKTVGRKYTDLAADSVYCTYLPEDPGGKDTGWMVMRMRVASEVYTNKLYFFPDWQIDETFCKIYNMRLAAEKKDTRIYLVTFQCTNCIEPMNDAKIKDDIGHIGLLRLTKAQADSLLFMPGLALDPEDEFTVLAPKEKADLVKKFEASGLIEKKDSSWYRYRRNEIFTNTVYGTEQMYDFLDTLFAIVSFDTLNDYNPYEQILRDLSHISRGQFLPDGISDEPNNPTTRTVRFTFKGKVYERETEQHGGLLFPGIIDDANTALEEQKVPGAFYTVLTRDNISLVVYIENDKVEKAKNCGFFTEFDKGTSPKIKALYGTLNN